MTDSAQGVSNKEEFSYADQQLGSYKKFEELERNSYFAPDERLNSGAFAALKEDGSVVTWGHWAYGERTSYNAFKNGNSVDSLDEDLESGVVKISAVSGNVVALKEDGSILQWGFEGQTPPDTADFEDVYSGNYSHFGFKEDGSVKTWGRNGLGPASSSMEAVSYTHLTLPTKRIV